MATTRGQTLPSGRPDSRARNPTKTIAADGSVSDDPSGPTGYSIIKADSLDAAVELAKGCLVLQGGASVQAVETFAVM